MNILHLVQNSLPYISGSTIRSNYIFKYQKRFANIVVLTSFLFKNDHKNNFEIINGIPYYRIRKFTSKILRFYYNITNSVIDYLFYFFKINVNRKILFLLISPFVSPYIKKLIKIYKIDIIRSPYCSKNR